jgi:hypothetical protein
VSPVIAERLEAVKDIPLSAGGHNKPPAGEIPGAFCDREKFSYVTGQSWGADPANCSRVINAMLRRWNDATDDAGLAAIDAWSLANLERLEATADDGHDEERGYIAADWAVRNALPVWLELAGATEAAATVRALKPLTDFASSRAARDVVRPIRDQLWKRRDEKVAGLREVVKKAIAEELQRRGVAAEAAGAAEAAWAAWAAGAAWAVGAAWAAWAAGAAGAAWAAGAAGAAEAAWAAWAAEAAGAADLFKVGSDAYWRFRDVFYETFKAKLVEAWTPVLKEKLGDNAQVLRAGAFETLDRMLAIGEAKES